eukprot:403342952
MKSSQATAQKKSVKKSQPSQVSTQNKLKYGSQKNGLSAKVALKTAAKIQVDTSYDYFEYQSIADFDRTIISYHTLSIKSGIVNEVKFVDQLKNYGFKNLEKSRLIPVCVEFPKNNNLIKGRKDSNENFDRNCIDAINTIRFQNINLKANQSNSPQENDNLVKILDNQEHHANQYFQSIYEDMLEVKIQTYEDFQLQSIINRLIPDYDDSIHEQKTQQDELQDEATISPIRNSYSTLKSAKKGIQRKREIKAQAKKVLQEAKARKTENLNQRSGSILDSSEELNSSDEDDSVTNPTDTKDSVNKISKIRSGRESKRLDMIKKAQIAYKQASHKQNQLNYNQPPKLLSGQHNIHVAARMAPGQNSHSNAQKLSQVQQSQQLPREFNIVARQQQLRNMMSKGQDQQLDEPQNIMIQRAAQAQQMLQTIQMGYSSQKNSQSIPLTLQNPQYSIQRNELLPNQVKNNQSQSFTQRPIQKQQEKPDCDDSDSDIEVIDSTEFQFSVIKNQEHRQVTHNNQTQLSKHTPEARPEQFLRPLQKPPTTTHNVFSHHLYQQNQPDRAQVLHQKQQQRNPYLTSNYQSSQKLSYGGNLSSRMQQLDQRGEPNSHYQFPQYKQQNNFTQLYRNNNETQNIRYHQQNSSFRNINLLTKKQRLL